MTVEYLIVECPANAPLPTGGVEFRGAVKKLIESRDFEVALSGAAETGKTYGVLLYLHMILWKYPGAQGVMLRKTYNSLIGTAIQTYLRIIANDAEEIRPKVYGGEQPRWFDYPNGSRLWIAGLDNPGKALSSERDFAYVNQAEEITEADWEILTTRCTGRGAVMPYTRVIADCNPAGPQHWIIKRNSMTVLHSKHEDNPTLFTSDGAITAQGTKTLGILDQLTGARLQRLRFGRWVQAEGVVYDGWDAEKHVIDRRPIPKSWTRYWVVDFGYTNPFCWQAWAEDEDGRLYRYKEIYKTQRTVRDHSRVIRKAWEGEPDPVAVICDHDAEDRATLEQELDIGTLPAIKEVSPGIQRVANRLLVAGDGRPRLFFMRDSLVEPPDELLVEAKKPTCTEQEFDGYVWDAKKDQPVKKDDHGLDCVRYLCSYVDRHSGEGIDLGPSSRMDKAPRGVFVSSEQNEYDRDGDPRRWERKW